MLCTYVYDPTPAVTSTAVQATVLKIELSDLTTVKPFVDSFLALNLPLHPGLLSDASYGVYRACVGIYGMSVARRCSPTAVSFLSNRFPSIILSAENETFHDLRVPSLAANMHRAITSCGFQFSLCRKGSQATRLAGPRCSRAVSCNGFGHDRLELLWIWPFSRRLSAEVCVSATASCSLVAQGLAGTPFFLVGSVGS